MSGSQLNALTSPKHKTQGKKNQTVSEFAGMEPDAELTIAGPFILNQLELS